MRGLTLDPLQKSLTWMGGELTPPTPWEICSNKELKEAWVNSYIWANDNTNSLLPQTRRNQPANQSKVDIGQVTRNTQDIPNVSK